MRVLFLAALAVLILSTPALASERGGGGHRPPPGPPPGCGGGCGGGGHHRPPGGNINVNVNANASASAFASAGSYINARTYSSGVFDGRYGGGGTIITGGGYGGDGYGYGCGTCGGVYVQDDGRAAYGPSMPFGYRVQGFGRHYRHPAWIGRSGGGGDCCAPRDDRYGREGGHDRGHDGGHDRDWDRDRGHDYDRGRGDCDCRGGRDERTEYRSESSYGAGSTYRSEEVRYEEFYGDLPPPDAPPMQAPPRQYYAQEPGERG